MPRVRAVANHGFGEDHYAEVLQSGASDHPRASLDALLGPLVSTERQVTHHCLVRPTVLITKFVDNGNRQCVLLGSRWEAALVFVLSDNPALVKTNIAREAHLVCQHILAV